MNLQCNKLTGVQHVAQPTFSLAVLLRNKPHDEWMQPCTPPPTASQVQQHYSDICCHAKLDESARGWDEYRSEQTLWMSNAGFDLLRLMVQTMLTTQLLQDWQLLEKLVE